ncbi:ATP-binding protein [Thiosulfativibrio zosterae]|uniref:histidine kinase n=1 Tax=Thiosulfativibrio zosterae TaxID=2675053 RepID=A0A6F8PL86_9GAMM|nr:ATP-binding protein [Thiosulfativibrio zosterae]BBP42824.1 hypothetical protein THMIRHAT_05700 [Thiosulfativibrio zosterae]
MSIELWLPAIFLFSGALLGAVGFYLRLQSQQLQKAIANLYDLNRSVNQDVLDFIDQAWLFLAQNGFQNMVCESLWYGEPQTLVKGAPANQSLQTYEINIEEDAIKLHLVLSAPKWRGEKQLLLEMVLQTFEMLLSFNVANKTKQFFVSQKRLEDYQLFVQHDTKNIAQFIALLEAQVSQAQTDEQKLKLVNRLKELLPSIVLRANRVTQPLWQSKSFDDVQPLSLKATIETLARSMLLSVKVEGDAQILHSHTLVTQVFHNLLDNFKAHAQDLGGVKVTILVDSGLVSVDLLSDVIKPLPPLSSQRVFEPFWTTSKSGLGLGLFIVRALLVKVQGKVKFVQTAQNLGFQVVLPSHIEKK